MHTKALVRSLHNQNKPSTVWRVRKTTACERRKIVERLALIERDDMIVSLRSAPLLAADGLNGCRFQDFVDGMPADLEPHMHRLLGSKPNCCGRCIASPSISPTSSSPTRKSRRFAACFMMFSRVRLSPPCVASFLE